MKRKHKFSGHVALSGAAAATLMLAAPDAAALGLGRLSVQSALGESLQAEIEITSMSAEEAANLRIRVAPPEAYRSANVEYNAVLPGTRATLQRRPDGRQFVRLTSDRGVQEPFVDVILEISWATGRLVREYTLLFDPPTMARAPAPSPAVPAAAARSTAPSVAEAPPAAPMAPPPVAAPRAERRVAAAPSPAAAPAETRAPSPPERAEHSERAFRRFRRRRVPRSSRRFAVAHRDEDAATRRLARPDAGRVVPHATRRPSSATT